MNSLTLFLAGTEGGAVTLNCGTVRDDVKSDLVEQQQRKPTSNITTDDMDKNIIMGDSGKLHPSHSYRGLQNSGIPHENMLKTYDTPENDEIYTTNVNQGNHLNQKQSAYSIIWRYKHMYIYNNNK